MCGFYSYHSKDEINRINNIDTRCGLQKAIDNGEELINVLNVDDKTRKKWREEIEWAKEIVKDPMWP